MKRAAQDDHAKAWRKIAKCYRTGIGVSEDRDEMRKAYLQAAQLGDPEAQYEMASLCAKDKKEAQAVHWLARSAAAGYKPAVKEARKRRLDYNAYKTSDDVDDLKSTLTSANPHKEWLEMLAGALLAALVFFLGARHMNSYNAGAAQIMAADFARFLCVALALVLIIIGACFSFSRLINGNKDDRSA